MVGLDNLRVRVETADDLARGIGALGSGIRRLIQDHNVRELDLIGQQMDQRALIFLAHGFATVAQEIMAGIILQQVHRIDDRDHRVEPGDIREALARLIAEIERGRDGQRLRDAGGFDQQVVKASLGGQIANLSQKIVAQRTANAAVRHFNKGFFGAAQLGIRADQVGVDIHL